MVFRFSDFELDAAERRLVRGGEAIPLRAKVFDTLCALVESHGRLVRKDDLMKRVWPDSIVEENNLDHNISKLRRALGETTNGDKFIETVPKVGYRFVPPVEVVVPPVLHKVQPMPDDSEFPAPEIKFFTTSDGVRLAYSISGSGPPLFRSMDWLNHLEFEWKNPFIRRWLKQVMSHHTLIRYDQRASGLSDWNVTDFSVERSIADMQELVDHIGLDRFTMVSSCQSGAFSIAFAANNPERVTKLVLIGSFARGWPAPDAMVSEEFNAMLTLIRLGWGKDNPAFRQLWTTLFMPDASREEMDWMNELQRITSSPENAVRMMMEFPRLNVLDKLPNVRCPTLVFHSRDDAAVPVREGRLIASRIPGARMVELRSSSHLVSPGEAAWEDFIRELSEFLGWNSEDVSESSQAVERQAVEGKSRATRV